MLPVSKDGLVTSWVQVGDAVAVVVIVMVAEDVTIESSGSASIYFMRRVGLHKFRDVLFPPQ